MVSLRFSIRCLLLAQHGLLTCLCISFVELPLGQELPDLDGLARLFADAPGNEPAEIYEQMSYTDMNLYRMIPDTYTSGTSRCPYRLQPSSGCSHLHAASWVVFGGLKESHRH